MPHTTILVYRDRPGKDPPLVAWLKALKKPERKAYAKCLGHIQLLERFGHELDRPTCGTLDDGIYELRIVFRSINYRILYFFCGKDVACLSHGITKEDRVPPAEIERAIKRMNLVNQDKDHYTQKWEE